MLSFHLKFYQAALWIWNDKKEVGMISSIYQNTRDGKDVIKPKCINSNKKYMKGIGRKTKKWSKNNDFVCV